MLNLKQPFAGIASSVLAIAASLNSLSLFDAPKFMGWVSFCLISFIPMEIAVCPDGPGLNESDLLVRLGRAE